MTRQHQLEMKEQMQRCYPVEHLNSLKLPGFPPHRLKLKVGAPVMLLRNINLVGGLCNGTRMIVTQLMTKLIEVQIITGTRMGEKVFTTQMELSSIAQLTPNSTNKTLEAKVYRKWVAKSPLEMTPYAFCCIILDREGNAIQANMTLKDIDYFNLKLQIGMAYRISNFICKLLKTKQACDSVNTQVLTAYQQRRFLITISTSLPTIS
ncbi:DNA helicase [Tanacetum coccineum]